MISTFRNLLAIALLCVANTVNAQDLDAILKSAPNQEALWSITVRDIDGNILEGFNSEKLIIPASNQKLFTTAAVLDGLGSDFRYSTIIYGDGALIDSVWKGDFIISGSGDPSISGIMYGEDRYFVFKSFLDQIRNKGISSLHGDIKAYTGYFDSEIYPKGWDWDDLSFYYGVEIAPLSFNNNAIDIIVNADGEIGSQPETSYFPYNTNYIEVRDNQVITDPSLEYDEFYRRELGTNSFLLASTLPQGFIEKESLSIQHAGFFFIESFEAFLKESINVKESYEVYELQNVPPLQTDGYSILASHTSEPLSKLIEWTNKESDNFYTEMLLKTLAAEKTNKPGSFDNGIKEVRNFLGRMGMDTTYVVMKDGSGMASGNFTKTSILSEFLVKMKSHEEFLSFYNSMSIAGIDGTIAHRMKGTSLYNNFKGKSGYVGGVRTLSGYFTTSSGQQLVISMAANNFIGKVRPIDSVHEQILEYLYSKY